MVTFCSSMSASMSEEESDGLMLQACFSNKATYVLARSAVLSVLRCTERHYQSTQPAKLAGQSLDFTGSGRHPPGRSTAASFHRTGLGKLAREVLKLCSSCFVSLAAVPIETYTAPCPSLAPCCTKSFRPAGRCLAASARIGPTICHQNQNRNRKKRLQLSASI